MSFIRGGETISIVRRSLAATDDYGNPTYTTSTITIKDALIAFGSTDAPIDAERDAQDAKLTIYLPAGNQIEPDDIFIIRSIEWVKAGIEQEWISPFTSFNSGIAIPVRKRIG